MTVAGGLRSRLIHDSLVARLQSGLTELGWFDSDRRHQPITLVGRTQDWDDEITVNTVAISTDSLENSEAEMGSNLALSTISANVDLYAENEAVGVELINDVRALLRGRIGSHQFPTIPIIDFRLATPAQIGYVAVNNVAIVHATTAEQHKWPGQRYLLNVDLVDYLLSIDDVVGPEDLYPGSDLFPGTNVYPGV